MPGLDKTGPNGEGPMTGRRMGTCVNNSNQTPSAPQAGAGFGRGLGLGRGAGRFCGKGRGRGFRNVYRATGLTRRQREQ